MNCGYDLEGLEARGTCPECGRSILESLAVRLDLETPSFEPVYYKFIAKMLNRLTQRISKPLLTQTRAFSGGPYNPLNFKHTLVPEELPT